MAGEWRPRLALALPYFIAVIVGLTSIGFTVVYVAQLRAQQLAACAFAADLGGIPLPDKPRPSRLGVSIVADSRAQWRGLHCPGTLPVPPGLEKWAKFYRIPVS